MKSLPIWNCRKSGDCCKRFYSSGPRIKESEKEKIIRTLENKEVIDHFKKIEFPREKISEYIKNHNSLPLQDKKTCAFLNSNNECIIHSDKPEVCRTYPLMIDQKTDKTEIKVDLDCPRGQDIVNAINNGDIPSWINAKKSIKVEGRYFYEDLMQDKTD